MGDTMTEFELMLTFVTLVVVILSEQWK